MDAFCWLPIEVLDSRMRISLDLCWRNMIKWLIRAQFHCNSIEMMHFRMLHLSGPVL
jgi:hypothetical protein